MTVSLGMVAPVALGASKRSPSYSTIRSSSITPNPTWPSADLKRAHWVIALTFAAFLHPRPSVRPAQGARSANGTCSGARVSSRCLALGSDESGAACPLVLGAQDRDWKLGRIGIRRNAMVEQVFRGFLNLDVAGERCDDRLLDALGPHLLDDLDQFLGEHHRRCDDGVPVAKNERVDARVFEAQPDRVLVRLGRFATGDVNRIAGGAK